MTSHALRCSCVACVRKERPDVFLPIRAERIAFVDTPWMTDALCREIGDGPFFPEKGESAQPGKAICRQCPARVPCLEFALTADTMLHGIWGGLTERERRRLGRTA